MNFTAKFSPVRAPFLCKSDFFLWFFNSVIRTLLYESSPRKPVMKQACDHKSAMPRSPHVWPVHLRKWSLIFSRTEWRCLQKSSFNLVFSSLMTLSAWFSFFPLLLLLLLFVRLWLTCFFVISLQGWFTTEAFGQAILVINSANLR